MSSPVEVVRAAAGDELAYIVRADWMPGKTTFVTPDSLPMQMGMIVYAAGTEIPRHMHLPVERRIQGTSEVVTVRRGECELDLFDEARQFVGSWRLRQGDIVLLLRGAHGFRLHEDTVLFEVKQGPYADGRDKEKF